MRGILDRLAEEAKTEEVYYNKTFPPSLYYRFLKLLTQEFKPRLSVELGVSGGGGSLHMALGNPEGKVIGIDIQDDHHERIEIIKKECPNFEFMLADSVTSAKGIYEKHGKIDLLFLDTDHVYDRTIAEFKAWRPYLSDNAIVCFDDLLRHHPDHEKSMMDAWNDVEGFKARYDWLHEGSYPHGGGFGVLYFKPVLVSRCGSCG
jgi:predicted O-methyltransferase YrrM